jgi:hypothetical protein
LPARRGRISACISECHFALGECELEVAQECADVANAISDRAHAAFILAQSLDQVRRSSANVFQVGRFECILKQG